MYHLIIKYDQDRAEADSYALDEARKVFGINLSGFDYRVNWSWLEDPIEDIVESKFLYLLFKLKAVHKFICKKEQMPISVEIVKGPFKMSW